MSGVRQQVLAGYPASGKVVHAHRAVVRRAGRSVDEHDRNALLPQPGNPLHCVVNRRVEHAADALLFEPLQDGQLTLGILVAVPDLDGVLLAVEERLRPARCR